MLIARSRRGRKRTENSGLVPSLHNKRLPNTHENHYQSLLRLAGAGSIAQESVAYPLKHSPNHTFAPTRKPFKPSSASRPPLGSPATAFRQQYLPLPPQPRRQASRLLVLVPPEGMAPGANKEMANTVTCYRAGHPEGGLRHRRRHHHHRHGLDARDAESGSR